MTTEFDFMEIYYTIKGIKSIVLEQEKNVKRLFILAQ